MAQTGNRHLGIASGAGASGSLARDRRSISLLPAKRARRRQAFRTLALGVEIDDLETLHSQLLIAIPDFGFLNGVISAPAGVIHSQLAVRIQGRKA
jgi:hypothetical protein